MMTTLKQQAEQSGLCFLDIDNYSEAPQLNTNDWPPLLGGWRYSHASVVLNHPEQDNNAQTVVVLGGNKQNQGFTNSVLLLHLTEENKYWREGPPLNNNRGSHAAVVCRGGVYVIGGCNRSSCLDSIERIDVQKLCSGTAVRTTSNQWTTLNCRLSTARDGCSAVTIYNRYIVVIGGCNRIGYNFSTVDIIDTAVLSNHTVIVGPPMTVPRCGCASAVIGNRIFAVGGHNGADIESVEYLEMHDPSGIETMDTASAVFPSSCRWTVHGQLNLSMRRNHHAVVAVGSCLIVMGGSLVADTVEVLDTRRNTVWSYPRSSGLRCIFRSAVVHSRGIAVISGYDSPSCATLSLVDKNTWCFRRLTEQVPRSIIFGTRTDGLESSPGPTLALKESGERSEKKLSTSIIET